MRAALSRVSEAGSATPVTAAHGGPEPKHRSTPAEPPFMLFPNVPEIVASVALAGIRNVPTVSTSQKLQGSIWRPPLNAGKISLIGPLLVSKVIVVIPSRITNWDVCPATKG
jgi:hypothetical protein